MRPQLQEREQAFSPEELALTAGWTERQVRLSAGSKPWVSIMTGRAAGLNNTSPQLTCVYINMLVEFLWEKSLHRLSICFTSVWMVP